MTQDFGDGAEELEPEGGRGAPRGRRLVQVLLGFNLFLVAVAWMLPSYADHRLSALSRDLSEIIAASEHIEVLRNDFASFYTDRAPREAVDAIFHQIEDGFDPHDLYTQEFRDLDARMVEGWRGFVQDYAFDCPPAGHTREDLARTFVLARQVFNRR